MKTTIYVTKYALTKGLFEKEAELVTFSDGERISAAVKDGYSPRLYHKGEFFLTKEEAISNCETRRDRKIKSLNKQIKELENLKF